MDNLKESIDKLLDSKPVYNEPVPELDTKRFRRKKSKKKLAEEEQQRNKSMADFGFNQNSMNIDMIKTLIELQRYCRRLEKTVEQNEKDYQKVQSAVAILKKELDNVRLRSTLNSNQIDKIDASINKCSEKLDDYMLSIAPGIRNSTSPKGCIESDISDAIGYFDKIEDAKKMDDMSELESFCQAALNKSLSASGSTEEIVVDFYGGNTYAAVLYNNISKNSIYRIKLLKQNDIPQGHFSLICTDTAFVPRKLMLRSAVVVITGDAPFEEITADELANLKFLNDCGLHTYVVLNENICKDFIEKGFRCVSPVSPDRLMSGDFVRLVEKAIENAVPAGAVSFGTLTDSLDNPADYYLTDPFDIADYAQNRRDVYPYNCLSAMENAVVAAIKHSSFPTGIVKSCRVSTAVEGTYNLVDGLNYINHLNYENRRKAYERAKLLLEPDGIFVVNGYDSVVGVKVRSIKGWNYYPSFEALWTKQQLISELVENGFKIKFIIPTGAGLFDNLPQKYKKSPAEWIIAATL